MLMRNDAPSFRLGTDAEEATPLLSASIEVKLENYRESAVGVKVKREKFLINASHRLTMQIVRDVRIMQGRG